MNEIKTVIDAYAPNVIGIYDDLFIADLERLKEIVSLIRAENIHNEIKFSCHVRANLVTQEVMNLLKEMNVYAVSFGAESASNNMLKRLKYGVSSEQNQQALDMLFEEGFFVNCSFIIGIAGETEEDLNLTFEFIVRNLHKLNEIYVLPLIPFPGTSCWSLAKERGLVSDSMDWNRFEADCDFIDFNRQILMNDKISVHVLHKYFLEFIQLRNEIKNKNATSSGFAQLRNVVQGLQEKVQELESIISNLRAEPGRTSTQETFGFLRKFFRL